MAKLKKAKVTITICPTCKGNGFVKVFSIIKMSQQYTNVGTVTLRESFMKRLIWVGLMMVLLTACTNLKFDNFDPATSTLKWIITSDKK